MSDDRRPAPGADRAARLRDARRRCRRSRRRLRRPAGAASRAAGRARLRPARRLRRPRAQREPVLPDRLRPALRGGDPRRRAGRRPGRARRQRVLRAWRARRRCRCGGIVFQDSACRASRATAPGRSRRSSATRASAPAAGSASSAGRRTPSGRSSTLPAFLVDELRGLVGATGLRRERHRPVHRCRGRPAHHQRGRQLAAFEWAALPDVQGVRRLLRGLRPGHDASARPWRCSAGTVRRCRATSC